MFQNKILFFFQLLKCNIYNKLCAGKILCGKLLFGNQLITINKPGKKPQKPLR